MDEEEMNYKKIVREIRFCKNCNDFGTVLSLPVSIGDILELRIDDKGTGGLFSSSIEISPLSFSLPVPILDPKVFRIIQKNAHFFLSFNLLVIKKNQLSKSNTVKNL